MKGFKAYAMEEKSIIRYIKMMEREKCKRRNYPTMPNRAAAITALNCVPTKFN